VSIIDYKLFTLIQISSWMIRDQIKVMIDGVELKIVTENLIILLLIDRWSRCLLRRGIESHRSTKNTSDAKHCPRYKAAILKIIVKIYDQNHN
jgi:hypothetical protein